MSNRVDDLEATVSELEATMRGLTEELVETKERLRAVEAELGVDAADLVDGELDRNVEPDASDGDDGSDGEPAARAEGDKTGEDQTTDDTDDPASGDDIIVA